MLDPTSKNTFHLYARDVGFWFIFVAVVISVAIVSWNYVCGDYVNMWRSEYYPEGEVEMQGSGEWRGGPGTSWAGFTFIGIPIVYLTGALGYIKMAMRYKHINSVSYKKVSLVGLIYLILFFLWVMKFSVWESVSQF